LIAEAIEKVKGLVVPTVREGKPGFVLSDRALNEYDVRDVRPSFVPVSTLTALVDLINAKLNDLDPADAIVRVIGHTEVYLTSRLCDKYGRRDFHVGVELPKYEGFKFGQFLDQESFLIGVMANFTEVGDREYLLKHRVEPDE
jgi:hypothetical protein